MNEPRAVYQACKCLARAFLLGLFRIRASGQGNIPREGGVILAANHESYLDPVAIGSCLPMPISYLARQELFDGPLLGWLLPRLNVRQVRRGEPNTELMRRAAGLLSSGERLVMFPEGTRTADGAFGKLHAGAGLLSKLARVPVVPVLVEGTFKAWPRTRLFPRPASVHVWFEKPLAPAGRAEEVSKGVLEAWTRRRNRIRQPLAPSP